MQRHVKRNGNRPAKLYKPCFEEGAVPACTGKESSQTLTRNRPSKLPRGRFSQHSEILNVNKKADRQGGEGQGKGARRPVSRPPPITPLLWTGSPNHSPSITKNECP